MQTTSKGRTSYFTPFFSFANQEEKRRFLVSSQKARISRPLRDRKIRVFSSLTKKNRIRPLSINKECAKSQFTILGFAYEGNLRAIWAIIYFSGHGLVMYYSSRLENSIFCPTIKKKFRLPLPEFAIRLAVLLI